MRRREFISVIGSAAAAWSAVARAQQPSVPVVGYLGSGSRESDAFRLTPFQQGLKEAGYVENRDVAFEYRWAENQNDRFAALAADLAARHVAVIVVLGGGLFAVRAAKAATTTIPIVFEVGVDPVEVGVVASLNRPGGNATGVTSMNVEIGPKELELLRELVPTATIVALLVNPTNPNAETLSKAAQAAARALGMQLHVLYASTDHDFTSAFAALAQLRAGGLVIGVDQLFVSRSEQIGLLTVRHAVPTVSPYRVLTAAGGLMSYGASLAEGYRQVGIYTGRILKGEKPSDLPVQQSMKIELVINLKTAKALGLTVPLSLLGRADEVIE
jgi:putative ABC transport system substrate-binding protein